jgi:NADH-quinone oxidoreductase subunit N
MNISLILPEITLFGGALFILMLDVFLGKKFPKIFYTSHLLSMLFCAITTVLIFQNFIVKDIAFSNMFVSNSFTSFAKAIAVVLLTLVILFSLNFVSTIQKISAEFLALLMIATTGGMILISANDFLVFYLGLELQALSLYLLAALNRTSAKSSEAGMKYFILGCLASGILLFGISMIYGFAGTTNFTALMELYHSTKTTENIIPVGVMFGFVLVLTAMFFKIAAAPFHMWSPDVYEGSASIVTTFFATVAKFTTVMALLHLFSTLIIGWHGIEKIFLFVAVISLAVGSFGAIFQTNFKRLLAYSSIGHVGFILLGIASFGKQGFVACVFYILIYAFISIGSFGFLTLMRSASFDKETDAENAKVFAISSLSGLAKTNPVMAFSLSALMFSTAGIPPLAGFFSKFYILVAAIGHGFLITAILAVLFSTISAYYYLRIVKIMYFDEPQKNVMELENIANVKFVIFLVALLNLVLIIFMQPLMTFITTFLLS